LYANENYPFAVVEELRRLGYDVVTTQDIGNAGRSVPDDDVLQTAIGMARAVLTHNRRDFIRLHGLRPKHCGIVICTVDKDFVGLARRIHEKLVEIGTIEGQLIRINRPRT
jgi:predicted nuclease of predicted toxin-antitoxin system